MKILEELRRGQKVLRATHQAGKHRAPNGHIDGAANVALDVSTTSASANDASELKSPSMPCDIFLKFLSIRIINETIGPTLKKVRSLLLKQI